MRSGHVIPTLVTAAALLAGCATPGDRESTSDRGISTDWVRIDQVRDFRALDNRNLVLYAPSRRQAYHVELGPACHGLRFADRIALRGRQGRIGGFAGDAVLIERGGSPERCPVSSVRRLDEAGLEELLARHDRRTDDEPAADETEVEIPRRDDDD